MTNITVTDYLKQTSQSSAAAAANLTQPAIAKMVKTGRADSVFVVKINDEKVALFEPAKTKRIDKNPEEVTPP